MKIFGITGGSGAGKSTVAAVWRVLGARILNCDKIYHELLCEDGRLVRDIEAAFPEAVGESGVDRQALGKIVFSDHAKLELLNDITHKYVLDRVRDELSKARVEGADAVAVEALYLLESGLSAMCDIVVGVVAPITKRTRRIMERDGLDDECAWARLRSQADDEYFIENCDIVIENNTTPERLREKARAVYGQLTVDS